MVLQDGFSDLYSDNRMSKMPISRPHCSRFESVPYTEPSDLMICSGDCGYPTSCNGCYTRSRSSLPDWDTYRQSLPPCGGYPQILEDDHVWDPSEISSMDSPEYMYEENTPRNYEGFELSNNGGKNVDAEELKPDTALFQNWYMEDSLCEVAAVVIQSAYRGYMVRKLDILDKMRKIADVREQVTKVGDVIQSAYREYMVRKSGILNKMGESADVCKRVTNVRDCISYLYAAFDPEVRKELERKVVVLLLQLDSLEVLPANIGEIRKSVAGELTGFLEELDCWPPAGEKEVSTVHMDRKNDESEGVDPSEIPSRDNESDAEKDVKSLEPGFSQTLPPFRFTMGEERPVVTSMVPDWYTYGQSLPPCNNYEVGYPQILEQNHVRDPSEMICSMDSPEYLYEENVPRNYEVFMSWNNGDKNADADAEEVNPDTLFSNGHMKDGLYDQVAAVVIQSAYRGYMVRKLNLLNKMRKIAYVREQVATVGDFKLFLCGAFDPEVGEEQRLILEEKVMTPLLQLDSLEDLPANIGDIRKSLARELTGLLEELDCWAARDKEMSTRPTDQINDESEGARDNETSDIPSWNKESDTEKAVESGFSKTLPSCRFFTKSEEIPVVTSMVSADLMTVETQSRILTKENEELRKLVKEHASLVSHLTRRVDVLEEKLAAEQNQVRGKLARNRYPYARDQDYNQNEEEEEIYDEADEQQYYHDERITYWTENSELLFLVLCCLLVWGIVWFM